MKKCVDELKTFKRYLIEDGTEVQKRPFVYPLFEKIFGKKFKAEYKADGSSADIYIEGKIDVELKTDYNQWLEGFYQALHYKKEGLSFKYVCVVAKNFLGLWHLESIPNDAQTIANKSSKETAPNEVGKANAKLTKKSLKDEIAQSAIIYGHYEEGSFVIDTDLLIFKDALENLDGTRIQINPSNFIHAIENFKRYFKNPMEAIHCFYSLVGYWNLNSKIYPTANGGYQVANDERGVSNVVKVEKEKNEFKKYVENHYLYENELDGVTTETYFGRFDEAIAKTNPEYVKQHGIFFTDINLAKFAFWFSRNFSKTIGEDYVVFDPAGGSGNLITSWKGRIRRKIISELQPELLKTVEMRMIVESKRNKNASEFNVVPKTDENEGLNFISRSAKEYFDILEQYVAPKDLYSKPLAFVVNPPYKTDDQNSKKLEKVNAKYDINSEIIKVAGNDAVKERSLAFLAQILNMSKIEAEKGLSPILLVFTPTSWLIPKITFKYFREEFDKHFSYQDGFIVNGNEFFKGVKNFPIAFTMWKYEFDGNRKNDVTICDYSFLKKDDLKKINWSDNLESQSATIKSLIKNAAVIHLKRTTKDILTSINGQTSSDIKRNPTKNELEEFKNYGTIYGGLPLASPMRQNKKTYGKPLGSYIGFSSDLTPIRIANDKKISSNKPDQVCFWLTRNFANMARTQILSGPAEQFGYCAYDLNSAKALFSWYAISEVLQNKYPLWANQYELWTPNITTSKADEYYSLCFAYGFARNSCIVTTFEKDNPVKDSVEIDVDNPMSPNNPDSFWSQTLEPFTKNKSLLVTELINAVVEMYDYFRAEYCPNGKIDAEVLREEPYFKYFSYTPYLTKNSGIKQIRTYASKEVCADLEKYFENIDEKRKEVKVRLEKLLLEDFKYFAC